MGMGDPENKTVSLFFSADKLTGILTVIKKRMRQKDKFSLIPRIHPNWMEVAWCGDTINYMTVRYSHGIEMGLTCCWHWRLLKDRVSHR